MSLDAASYPHILDSVLSLADRGALLVLRGVSRSLQEAADARLAEHLTLHIPVGGLHVHSAGPRIDTKLLRDRLRQLDVKGVGGRHPVFMGWAGVVDTARRRHATPVNPQQAGDILDAGVVSTPEEAAREIVARRDARKATRARCAGVLSHASVVDVTSFPSSWLRDGAPDLLRSLSAVVYRFHRPWYAWDLRPFTCATVAIFTPLVPGPGAEWAVPVPFNTFRGCRLVINLTGFWWPDDNPWEMELTLPPTADAMHCISAKTEVVLNLTALATAKIYRGSSRADLAFPTARIVFRNPTTRFTLVGAVEMAHAFGCVGRRQGRGDGKAKAEDGEGKKQEEGEEERQEERGVQESIKRTIVNTVNRLRSWYPNYWTAEALESLPSRITLVSADEYRGQMSEERFTVEAVG